MLMKITHFMKSRTLMSFVSISILFSSCIKDKEKDTDTNSSKNESIAESYFNELNSISDQAATTGSLSGFKLSSDLGSMLATCAIITIDTSENVSVANPDTFKIDFGTGCLGNDGKTRRGILIVTASGRYLETGTVVTIRPSNYFVNNNQITGFRRVTNLGMNDLNQPSFSVEVDGSVILANNAGTITWTANRVRTWMAGSNTPFLFYDDEFGLTGTSSGTKTNGLSWSSIINTQLVYRHSCREIVSGSITITPDDKPARLVDFGTGACDGTASATISGNTYIFTFQ
jgi:hypothetical protein